MQKPNKIGSREKNVHRCAFCGNFLMVKKKRDSTHMKGKIIRARFTFSHTMFPRVKNTQGKDRREKMCYIRFFFEFFKERLTWMNDNKNVIFFSLNISEILNGKFWYHFGRIFWNLFGKLKIFFEKGLNSLFKKFYNCLNSTGFENFSENLMVDGDSYVRHYIQFNQKISEISYQSDLNNDLNE